MDRQTAREELKTHLREYVESITTESKGGFYVCPLCGSGTGAHATGAFSITDNGKSWKCFSCNEMGDLFDLIGKHESIADHSEQLKRAGELFNISIDRYNSRDQLISEFKPIPDRETHTHNSIQTPAEETDYTAFLLEAQKHLAETDYHTRRGISSEMAERFELGYCENWRHPDKPTAPTTPRLIIPTSKYSYLARDTRSEEEIPERQKNYTKQKAGNIHIFNATALKTATQPIFIVEGEIDAISIIEVGGEAVGLGNLNIKSLIPLLATAPAQPLIIALDNDKRGIETTPKLEEELKALNIPFITYNPYGDHKDANEALIADREAFKEEILNATAEAEYTANEEERTQREEYLKNSTANYIDSFINGIDIDTLCIPTGFEKLDKVLEGGLYEGFYVIGAVSSLGKTTFTMQLADQIAQAGTDILIFSLEMGRTELMAKSISRHTLTRTLATGGDIANAKTDRGITTGKRYKDYNETELQLIKDSITDYSTYAQHIFISEGVGDIGIEKIKETIQKHIRFTGNKPVVIIDYLQILAPYSEKMTDKQNTDKAVLELKRISRDLKLPVIAISSFNRDSYKGNNEASMASFKESGAIEYTSDILIALQPQKAGKDGYSEEKEMAKSTRELELKVLKNRHGKRGEKIEYSYYTLFNYFEEN